MLLRNNTRIIEKVLVDLYFDDNTDKHIEISEKDIISVDYNDNGYRRQIEGKVVRIINKPIPPKPLYNGSSFEPTNIESEGYMTIDGSGIYSGKCVNIYFSHILDCEMIERYDENLIVKTVENGCVNRIRISEDQLQVSQDNGKTWLDVITLLGTVDKLPFEDDTENTTTTE